ncbi:MAG TPA: DPP IV N-terminal domain-containing protein, partial [Blastocatellia bacterium]|nr:DPP IV N-terminal domain-containing protein [Blastocatellia bacterium]
MIKNRTISHGLVAVLLLTIGVLPMTSPAQDRLKTMPGYDQYQKMSKEIPGSVKLGALNVKWQDDGKAFDYYKDGKTYRYDIATGATTEAAPADAESGRMGGRRRAGGPDRGRQYSSAESPDKKLKAFYRDRNLWLSDAAGAGEMAITTDGNEKARTKYGTGSWVYGEELDQVTAMWWSPN